MATLLSPDDTVLGPGALDIPLFPETSVHAEHEVLGFCLHNCGLTTTALFENKGCPIAVTVCDGPAIFQS